MIGTRGPKAIGQVLRVPIREIMPNPDQPRKNFDKPALEELARSIAANGLLQPITVSRTENGWQLVAGHRRLMACELLGWQTIPAIEVVVTSENSAVLALIENIHRSGLNYFEEASAIESLMKNYSFTQVQVAAVLGRSQPSVANKLRLLRLPEDVKAVLLKKGLTERHARALLRLDDAAACLKAVNYIADRQMSVSKAEKYIDKLASPKLKRSGPPLVIRDIRILFNSINKAVETVRQGGVPIDTVKTEDEEFIHYTVSVPKTTAIKRAVGK